MMIRKIVTDRPGRTQENSEQNDAEMEENLFKADEEQSTEEMNKQTETEEFTDDNNPRVPAPNVTMSQLQNFAEKIGDEWKKLASKLGFKQDEVQFFIDNNENEVERAKNVIHLWFEDDEDATLENFLYILEGLGLNEAAEAVRAELNSVE